MLTNTIVATSHDIYVCAKRTRGIHATESFWRKREREREANVYTIFAFEKNMSKELRRNNDNVTKLEVLRLGNGVNQNSLRRLACGRI